MISNLFDKVIQPAVKARYKWRVPASVTLAQWAVESAFGHRMPVGSNNPFGIKAMQGFPSVPSWTREELHGRNIHTIARFAKFPNLATAFDQHAKLIATHDAYHNAMNHVGDPDAFANALTGVYATDHAYGHTLIQYMHTYNLYEADRL